MAKNTAVSYLYRDASNYKQPEQIVVAGTFKFEDIADTLEDGENFIPSQVGLEDLQPRMEKFPSSDDHVWHEIGPEDIIPTDVGPTYKLTAEQLVAGFKKAAKDGWNLVKATQQLGL